MQTESSPNEKRVVRNFGLSTFAINNRTSTVILMFLILWLGVTAYKSMPKENFPEITIPTIYVGTSYPGNSPLDIENLITRPIEKEINSISGVSEISSSSIQDYSTIIVEFDFDVDVAEALLDVKDAVDKAKSELPTDLDRDPNVFEMDFAEIPVLNINISGDEYSMAELKYYGEYLQDEIEALGEISKVELRGGLENEVKINVDKNKMESLMISFGDVESAIARENMTISGGDILVDDFRRSIRVIGEFENMADIENVIVKSEFQEIVFLKDIADVAFGFEETKSFSRSTGSPVITLEVKKRSGENLLIATDKIKDIVKEAVEEKFPKNLLVEYSNDTSRMTRLAVDNLENSIISGVILVVLVLLFFLGLRNALFVGIAIPLSMLMGFLILNALGITLNMMVLFSLILALGMLVDNGIVVVENIYRLMQEGYPPLRAAKEGVGEVALPIITSTGTTLAAFFPLLLWDDIMGEFMKYLPMTLIIVLASSLFVALVINPVLTSLLMKVQDERSERKRNRKKVVIYLVVVFVLACLLHLAGSTTFGNIFGALFLVSLLNVFVFTPLALRFQEVTLPRLERWYEGFLRFALRGYNPLYFLASMMVLLVFSLIFYFVISQPLVTLFPTNIPNYVNIFIEAPSGTDIEKTNEITEQVEDAVFAALRPYEKIQSDIVESILTNVGEGTSDPNSGEGAMNQGATPNKSKITVSFVEFQYRNDSIDTEAILQRLRTAVDTFPGVKITVDKDPIGPPVGPPISIEVSGEDYETLIEIAEEVKVMVNNSDIKGIEELKTDLDIGKPELLINVDRAAARRYGLSTGQIQGAIRTALFGKEVSKFKEGEDEYPIMVRLKDEYRYDLQSLLDQRITFRDQASGNTYQVPISSVADIQYASTYAAVNRKDLDRVITIYSNIKDEKTDNPAKIIEQLSVLFEDYELPEGYGINFTGEVEQQEESMAFLGQAFLVAVFLIFLIIITQFNSLTTPFIIMLSVLFSTIGVFLGLATFNMNFIVIMTGIGIISLAGVVVNNAIVLIDYTNLVRERKRKELEVENNRLPKELIVEAIVEGGKTRLRPVLLTAITTVLGLVPLAVGFNINFETLMSNFDPQIFIGGDNVVFWGPMSWTVIFGLTFATFLTLVIVPVMYLSFERLSQKVLRSFK